MTPRNPEIEKVAQRISEIMTDEIRETILRLKYETPETEKIIGVESVSYTHLMFVANINEKHSSIYEKE